MAELNVGDPAPDFMLPSIDNAQWSLSAARGEKNVLVSFHVFDFTGDNSRGCTCQISSWREAYPRIEAADGEVVEVSADSVHSHRRWAQDLGGVPFPFLADFSKKMTDAFGILNPENGAARRSAFVIDKNGVVRYKNTSFNASEPSQYEEVIKALEALK